MVLCLLGASDYHISNDVILVAVYVASFARVLSQPWQRDKRSAIPLGQLVLNKLNKNVTDMRELVSNILAQHLKTSNQGPSQTIGMGT